MPIHVLEPCCLITVDPSRWLYPRQQHVWSGWGRHHGWSSIVDWLSTRTQPTASTYLPNYFRTRPFFWSDLPLNNNAIDIGSNVPILLHELIEPERRMAKGSDTHFISALTKEQHPFWEIARLQWTLWEGLIIAWVCVSIPILLKLVAHICLGVLVWTTLLTRRDQHTYSTLDVILSYQQQRNSVCTTWGLSKVY